MEEQTTPKLNRPQNGLNKDIRDIRDNLGKNDLEIYERFTHGRDNTLASLRQARHKDALLKALKETHGYVGKACDAVGISRRTYYSYVADDPLFAEMVLEIREGVVDLAEDKLITNVKAGFEASIIFYLKTQGRRRGYGDSNQIGSFQGTQEEYYQNMLKDMDDTTLLDEIAQLRKKLKIPDDATVGGYDESAEEFQDEIEEDIIKDIELKKSEIGSIVNMEETDIITPSIDELLDEMDEVPKNYKEIDYRNKHIIKEGNEHFNG